MAMLIPIKYLGGFTSTEVIFQRDIVEGITKPYQLPLVVYPIEPIKPINFKCLHLHPIVHRHLMHFVPFRHSHRRFITFRYQQVITLLLQQQLTIIKNKPFHLFIFRLFKAAQ